MQRGSVIAGDCVLLSAAWYATRRMAEPRRSAAFLVMAGSAGLLLVDHLHFQYNGLLLGARARAVRTCPSNCSARVGLEAR